MTRFIAVTSLFALSILNSLGNFWFTYGIWPRSWVAFVFFFVSGFVLMVTMQHVGKSE